MRLPAVATGWPRQLSALIRTRVDLLRSVESASSHPTYPFRYAVGSRRKILVLSVSAGAGHVRAAEAIRLHAHEKNADTTVIHLDAMDYVPSAFRKIYADWYLSLVGRHPTLWGCLYRLSNRADPDSTMQRLRRAIERMNTGAMRREIALLKPDAIICTHFLPAELLARTIRRGQVDCPVWVQVTDFDVHRMWVHNGMAGYFAANEEVAYRMRAYGIAPQKIHVTGIPIMPAFGQALSRAECAHALGLDPGRMTILLMGGGAGIGRLEEVAARLLDLNDHFQIIALAGKNRATFAALQALAGEFPGRLVAQGYTQEIERLMACADLAVTKPGGLTTSECLAMGLPMIVNEPIPGQEERNADFLLEQGVAMKAYDAVTLEYRVRHLLRHPEKLAEMGAKAKALGRPAAARGVLDTVVGRMAV